MPVSSTAGSADPFVVRVPATSANVGPGFDCLGVALRLYLELRCEPATEFALDLQGEGSDFLPRDARNFLVRAVLQGGGFTTPPAVRLTVANSIPLARGLGSSSAAAVAGLTAGALLRDARMPSSEAILGQSVALEGHPDNVAPAIFGDLVISGVARDGSIPCLRESWPDRLVVVAVIPELRVRTDDARRALPASIPFGTAVANSARLARLLGALRAERFDLLRESLEDELHQPYRLPLGTGLAETLEALREHPEACGAYLSGSGPTLAGLTVGGPDAQRALGEEGVASMRAHGVASRWMALPIDRDGLRVDRAGSV